MAVLGEPTTKCPHGVFKAGESVARYCSFCNPASAYGVRGLSTAPVVEELEVVMADDDFEAPEGGWPDMAESLGRKEGLFVD